MKKNLIFYFSGTGNSLYIAKEIAKKLTNTRIFTMGRNETFNFEK